MSALPSFVYPFHGLRWRWTLGQSWKPCIKDDHQRRSWGAARSPSALTSPSKNTHILEPTVVLFLQYHCSNNLYLLLNTEIHTLTCNFCILIHLVLHNISAWILTYMGLSLIWVDHIFHSHIIDPHFSLQSWLIPEYFRSLSSNWILFLFFLKMCLF